MSNDWSRRELLATIGGALAAARNAAGAVADSPAPASATLRRLARPYLVASANAAGSRSAAGVSVAAECLARLARGERTLGAIVAAVEICELDPEETSVGYGGLPNSDGVVELDAAVMESERGGARRAGGVAALTGVRTPSRVALAVADRTDNHLYAGAGARAFARTAGFAADEELLTERSRAAFREWKARRSAASHSALGKDEAERAARRAMVLAGRLDPLHLHGTIHVSAFGLGGDVAAATSTSGLAFKPPGRIGDSPILGAGLYCDAAVGAAGSTGRGEANLLELSSAWIVEEMRRGRHPKDAAMAALARVRERTPAAHRRGGEPDFSLQFFVADLEGRAAGVSLYRDFDGSMARFVAADREGIELRECDALLERFRTDGG